MFLNHGFVDAGGDVEVSEVWPAEGAGGGFQARQFDAPKFCAGFWIQTRDTAAMAERDP